MQTDDTPGEATEAEFIDLCNGSVMHLTDLRSLLRHMEWADALTWNAVLMLPSSQPDSRLRELLHHYHSTQYAYLQILRGEQISIPELHHFGNLRSLAGWAREYYLQLPSFADGLSDSALDCTIELPWADQLKERFGAAIPATLGETLLQVVMHSTYHRGQAAARTRELGGEPPLTDFVAWIWMGRPPADWERIDADEQYKEKEKQQ